MKDGAIVGVAVKPMNDGVIGTGKHDGVIGGRDGSIGDGRWDGVVGG